MKRILYLEDDNRLAGIVVEFLSRFYTIEHVSTLEEIEPLLKKEHYDVAILDRNIDGSDIGLRAIELIHKYDEKMSIVITSSYSSVDNKIEGLELGADDYLEKPFNIRELETRIAVQLRRKRSLEAETKNITTDINYKKTNHQEKTTEPNPKIELETVISFKKQEDI